MFEIISVLKDYLGFFLDASWLIDFVRIPTFGSTTLIQTFLFPVFKSGFERMTQFWMVLLSSTGLTIGSNKLNELSYTLKCISEFEVETGTNDLEVICFNGIRSFGLMGFQKGHSR